MLASKKFLLILCMAAILIFVAGCGSDSSNSSNSSTTSTAVNPSPPQTSSVKTGLLNVDNFIKQYNAALDALGNRYDKMKIVGKRNDEQSCFELKLYSQNINVDNNFPLSMNYRFSLLDTNLENINLSNFDNREIFFIGYDSLQPTDPANKAAYIAVLKSFPQFRDLDYEAILNQLATVGADNFQVNGLEVKAIFLNNHCSFSVTDLSFAEMVREQQAQKRQSEEQERNRTALEERKAGRATGHNSQSPDDWSIGGISLDNSVEQVRQLLGGEKEIRASQDTPGNSYYEYNDVVVCMNGGKVIGIATYTNALPTEMGIRQGDTLSKVFSAYGNVWYVKNFNDLTLYEYPLEFRQSGFGILRFAVKNNAVEYVSLRRVRSEEYYEIYNRKRTILNY